MEMGDVHRFVGSLDFRFLTQQELPTISHFSRSDGSHIERKFGQLCSISGVLFVRIFTVLAHRNGYLCASGQYTDTAFD